MKKKKTLDIQKAAVDMNTSLNQEDENFSSLRNETCMVKMKKFIVSHLMIEPKNKRLGNFHLLTAVCFYVDFFMTGFIIGNYHFVNKTNQDKYDVDFLYHNTVFFIIIIIQATDIILTFFKV